MKEAPQVLEAVARHLEKGDKQFAAVRRRSRPLQGRTSRSPRATRGRRVKKQKGRSPWPELLETAESAGS